MKLSPGIWWLYFIGTQCNLWQI